MSGNDRHDYRAVLKRDDGFVATFLSAPIANGLLRWVAPLPVTPNQVTLLSTATALAAAVAFAAATGPGLVAGALLVQLAFVLDCLDGQLARLRGQQSRFGAWLDLMGDYLQDIVLFAGVALGCARRQETLAPLLWGYAAILVVYYRHFDSVFLAQTLRPGYLRLVGDPLVRRDDPEKAEVIDEARQRAAARWGPAGRLLDVLAPKGTLESRAAVFWLKRAALLSGGERYLVVSLLALAGRPEWILPVIVVWGLLVYPLITLRRWSLFGGE